MLSLASGVGRNIVFNPDTSGLVSIEKITTLKYYGGIAWTAVSASATLSTTLTQEIELVQGGKTITLTLTGDTWVAAGATFDAQRQSILGGMVSGSAGAYGWNATFAQPLDRVVRTSDTVVTILLDKVGAYAIAADETITVTIPADALTLSSSAVAAGTFEISIDEYADAGFPTRNFYNRYWMGTVPADEIEAQAQARAKASRQEYQIIPRDVQDIILPVAKKQVRKSRDEAQAQMELADALEQQAIEWDDRYARYLEQLRAELQESKQAREQVRRARARASKIEVARMEREARRQVVARARALEDARAALEQRRAQNKDIAMTLLMSVS